MSATLARFAKRHHLYDHRDKHGLVHRRYGRRPVCLATLTLRDGGSTFWCWQIGALGITWGGEDGVSEGRAGVGEDKVRWGHTWFFKSGKALDVSWTRD